MSLIDQKLDRQRLLVVFGAACLFFSTLEYLIPKPPFFRIGLANLPVLLALPIFSPGELIALTLVKILGQGLVGGTLFSYVALFSAGSSIASLLAMFVVQRMFSKHIGWLGLSLIGAAAANIVQMLLSVGLVFGAGAWFIIPVFMAFGLAAGVVVGLVAMVVSTRSHWYLGVIARYGLSSSLPLQGQVRQDVPDFSATSTAVTKSRKRRFRLQLSARWDFMGRHMAPSVHGILALLVFPAFILQNDLFIRSALTGFWILMTLFSGKRLQPLYFIGTVLSITAFNLFLPAGEILFSFFGFSVTLEALKLGLSKALGFVGQIFISLALVRNGLRIPGVFGAWMAEVLLAYQILLAGRGNLKGRKIMSFVDDALINLEAELDQNTYKSTTGEQKTSSLGWVLFLVILVIHYLLMGLF